MRAKAATARSLLVVLPLKIQTPPKHETIVPKMVQLIKVLPILGTVLKSIFVILGAGQGTRFSNSTPKILANLIGKPVIQRTIESVTSAGLIDEVLIVTSPENISAVTEIVSQIGESTPIRIVLGGSSRNRSTLLALRSISETEAKILIHDAVRPFVSERIIRDCLKALDSYNACDVSIPSADTIINHHGGFITGIPDRSDLHRGQTPQGFILSKIRAAYEMAGGEDELNQTDDCGVFMQKFPEDKIYLVDGEEKNIKITTFSDLIHAESIIGMEYFLDLGSGLLQNLKIQGKNALIFGASSGIGKVLHEELLSLGVPTLGASRSLSKTDVTNPESVRSFLAKASKTLGPINLIYNCAGDIVRGGLDDLSYPQIEEVLRTNVLGATTVLKESLPIIQKNKGSVTLISSSAATVGRNDQLIYAASKAAVENIAQAFSDQVTSLGVRVNAIRPSRTSTASRLRVFGQENPKDLLCPRFVARAIIEVSLSDFRGKVFPLTALDQDESWRQCIECLDQTHE
jgi:2-C-methyl-D-erythritol 4-phosphate cytidylyltransferase